VEEIEYYTHLNLSYSGGSLFLSPALTFANAYKEDLFMGHFVNYGTLSCNFATCALAKKKIT